MITKLNLFLYLSLAVLLTSCNGQNINESVRSETARHTATIGDTVSQFGNNIMVIFQDSKNNYWFGSWQSGLYHYNGKTIIHYTTKHGLPSNRVEEIKEDKQGNIYINTSKGIIKYNQNQIAPLQEAFGNPDNWSLSPNDLWFKNFTPGSFVYRFDGMMLHPLKFPKTKLGEDWIKKHPSSPASGYDVYTIYKDQKGNVWFGTAILGAMRYNGQSFDWISETDVTELHDGPANGVRSIIEDKDGYFWFNSAYRYKILDSVKKDTQTFYERQKSIGNLDGQLNGDLNEYLAITKDQKQNLWIATYRRGVWKYDGKTVKHYNVQENGKGILLFYVYTDHAGNIWLGTHENGVWKLQGDVFKRFNG